MIAVKGCINSIISRNGDGEILLKSMLKEYLIGEAMYYLNIQKASFLKQVILYTEQIKKGINSYKNNEKPYSYTFVFIILIC